MRMRMGKGLSEKADRTPVEEDRLNRMLRGGDRASEDNLTEWLDWFFGQK